MYANILNDKDASGFTHKEGNLYTERWEKYNKVVSGMNHCRVNLTTEHPYPSNDNYGMIQHFIEDKLENMESRSNYRNG